MSAIFTYLKQVGQRTFYVLCGILIGIDVTVQNVLRGVVYIPTGKCKPGWRETISAWMGTAANAGYEWGILGEDAIDELFGPTHCQDAAADEKDAETPAF